MTFEASIVHHFRVFCSFVSHISSDLKSLKFGGSSVMLFYVNLLSPSIKQITFSRNIVDNCIDVVLTKVTRNKEKLWNLSYYKTL